MGKVSREVRHLTQLLLRVLDPRNVAKRHRRRGRLAAALLCPVSDRQRLEIKPAAGNGVEPWDQECTPCKVPLFEQYPKQHTVSSAIGLQLIARRVVKKSGASGIHSAGPEPSSYQSDMLKDATDLLLGLPLSVRRMTKNSGVSRTSKKQ